MSDPVKEALDTAQAAADEARKRRAQRVALRVIMMGHEALRNKTKLASLAKAMNVAGNEFTQEHGGSPELVAVACLSLAVSILVAYGYDSLEAQEVLGKYLSEAQTEAM